MSLDAVRMWHAHVHSTRTVSCVPGINTVGFPSISCCGVPRDCCDQVIAARTDRCERDTACDRKLDDDRQREVQLLHDTDEYVLANVATDCMHSVHISYPVHCDTFMICENESMFHYVVRATDCTHAHNSTAHGHITPLAHSIYMDTYNVRSTAHMHHACTQ